MEEVQGFRSGLIDPATGERHRADILCNAGTQSATVLELQHSSLSEDERTAREIFYRKTHRMFWLVHIHNETTFAGYSFGFSLDFSKRPHVVDGRHFAIMRWIGRSKKFIEKWKRATGHVFFDWNGHIYFLAGEALVRRMTNGASLQKGEFALCPLTRDNFIRAIRGIDQHNIL